MNCGHCERPFPADELYPVIVTGGQSYLGHILKNRPQSRRANLCGTCRDNLSRAPGMVVERDIDAERLFPADSGQAGW